MKIEKVKGGKRRTYLKKDNERIREEKMDHKRVSKENKNHERT